MNRRHYLITYDVSDDKRRNKIFEALQDSGDHAQFSVFFCELSRQELAALKARLTEIAHAREDQILIVDLGDVKNPLENGIQCIGQRYEPATRVIVV